MFTAFCMAALFCMIFVLVLACWTRRPRTSMVVRLCVEQLEQRELPSAYIWNGPNDGKWSVSTNWLDDGPAVGPLNQPNPATFAIDATTTLKFDGRVNTRSVDDVTVVGSLLVTGYSGTITLRPAGNTLTVANSLAVGSGILTGSGTGTIKTKLLVEGAGSSFTWTGGQIAGVTLSLGETAGGPANPTSVINGAGDKQISGTDIDNFGTLTWKAGNIIADQSRAGILTTLKNESGATFNVQAAASFTPAPSGGLIVQNDGVLNKAGSGTSTFNSTQFRNSGQVWVNAGTLAGQGVYSTGAKDTFIQQGPDAFTVIYGTLQLSENYTLLDGNLIGNGTLDTKQLSHEGGTVWPGIVSLFLPPIFSVQPNVLTIYGSYVETAGGTLAIRQDEDGVTGRLNVLPADNDLPGDGIAHVAGNLVVKHNPAYLCPPPGIKPFLTTEYGVQGGFNATISDNLWTVGVNDFHFEVKKLPVVNPWQFTLEVTLGKPAAAIGGNVYAAAFGGGAYNPANDAGLSAVAVQLWNADDDGDPTTLQDTTTTDDTGVYTFNAEPVGQYVVKVLANTGWYFATMNDDGSNVDPSTGLSSLFEATEDDPITINAGLYQTGSLSGVVWNDSNADGILNNGETGAPGVTLTLVSTTGSQSPTTATSDGDGNYSFTGVVPGSYYVQITPLTNDSLTLANQGDDPTLSSVFDPTSLQTLTLQVASGADITYQNAGLTPTINGTVWKDENGDGYMSSGEPGVAGATLALLDDVGNPVVDVAGNPLQATTGSDGTYQFTQVANGDYQVELLPSTYNLSPANQGSDPSVNSKFTLDDDTEQLLSSLISVSGTPVVYINAGITAAATRTALTSSPDYPVFGQSVTLTATVSAAISAFGTPTGTVTFTDGDDTLGTADLVDGVATLNVTDFAVGDHSIIATYNNDASFATSSSDADDLTVFQATSSVAVSTDDNGPGSGQSFNVTATVTAVTPGAGVPSGSVTFRDENGNLVGSGPVTLVDGVASVAASLGDGSHTITAQYGGDDDFTDGMGSLALTVGSMGTAVTVTSSDTSPVFGEALTLTATVNGGVAGSPVATGTVTFTDENDDVLGGATLVDGVASVSVSSLAVGAHTITASYSGDDNYGEGSTDLAQSVFMADSSVAVSSDSFAPVFGQTLTITANVTAVAPGAGSPSGTVTFTDEDGNVLGSGPVDLVDGAASLQISSLDADLHFIMATYSGDGNFIAGSGEMAQWVSPADTQVTVSSDNNSPTYGQTITLTANVSAVSPSTGLPSGTVTFVDESDNVLGEDVAVDGDGNASIEISTLAAGSHTITATFTPDNDDFNGSSGSMTQAVSPAALTITADDAQMTYGDDPPAFSGTGDNLVNGDTLDSLGVTFTTDADSTSPAGTYAINGSASNGGNYSITFVAGTLTVNPCALTITANDAQMTYGDDPPAFSGTGDNLVNGDTLDSLGVTFTTDADSTSPVGPMPSTASASNGRELLDPHLSPGRLTVNPCALTITANDAQMTYGDDPPAFSGTGDNLVNGDTLDSLGVTFTTVADSTSPAGTYAITGSASSGGNYSITFVAGTLTVNQRSLTITANDSQMNAGDSLPTFTGTGDNLVNGDTLDSLGVVFTTNADSSSEAGEYAITPGTASSGNFASYSISYVAGTLTIS